MLSNFLLTRCTCFIGSNNLHFSVFVLHCHSGQSLCAMEPLTAALYRSGFNKLLLEAGEQIALQTKA